MSGSSSLVAFVWSVCATLVGFGVSFGGDAMPAPARSLEATMFFLLIPASMGFVEGVVAVCTRMMAMSAGVAFQCTNFSSPVVSYVCRPVVSMPEAPFADLALVGLNVVCRIPCFSAKVAGQRDVWPLLVI